MLIPSVHALFLFLLFRRTRMTEAEKKAEKKAEAEKVASKRLEEG